MGNGIGSQSGSGVHWQIESDQASRADDRFGQGCDGKIDTGYFGTKGA
jgi:hypothetical protein